MTAYGTLADTASEELEAFKKFTKETKNREKAQILEEAVRVALHLAASREHGLKKASFSMDPLLHAETLEYLCSFDGGMEDPRAKQQMLAQGLGDRGATLRRASLSSGDHSERFGSRPHAGSETTGRRKSFSNAL